MTNKLNIAIIGSRKFDNRIVLNETMVKLTEIVGTPTTIVSGGAMGADTVGVNWAEANNIDTKVFLPLYNDFPKKTARWEAPKSRNTTIVENSDIVLAFWDFKSTGTKDTIDKATAKGVTVYIYNTNDGELTIINE
jgi:hypothetical protein